jgi:hypothetical protein
MRSITEYLQRAKEFETLEHAAGSTSLKKRYADLAECYRLLAHERQRLIEAGEIEPD